METAATKIARLNRSIARTGETVTLQRTAVGAAGAVSIVEQITCPAHVRASAPQDVLGGEDVREMRVIISATALAQTSGSPPVPFNIPAKDDIAVIQGRPANVVDAAPIYYGGQLVRVNLLCRGGRGRD